MDGCMDPFIYLFMLIYLFILKQRNYKKTTNKKTQKNTSNNQLYYIQRNSFTYFVLKF